MAKTKETEIMETEVMETEAAEEMTVAENAENESPKAKEADEAEAKKRNKEYLNERVPVRLQRPEGEKMAHRTITVNGKNFQIQYGVQVMVPRYVKNVIDESIRNAANAQRRMDEVLEEQARNQQ